MIEYNANLLAIRKLVDELHFKVEALPDTATPDELLQFASNVHELKSMIGFLFADVQDVVVERLDYLADPVYVDGATVEIKSSAPRKKWDHESLIKDVSKRIVQSSVNLDTGEVTMTTRQMVEAALTCAGVSYWKSGELKKLNIDVDEYCEVGDSKKSLVIRREK